MTKKNLALVLTVMASAMLGVAPAVAQPTHPAVYEVTFDATWSAVTHPSMFPSNAHFSWLIGGSHDDQIAFWTPGDTASQGIKSMAETGSTSPLDAEVLAAVAAGRAGEVIESAAYPWSPGSVSAVFTATPEHPLATVVTMVAPSPDWFTGVRGLDLRDGDAWATSLTVDLYPYDAGTDSGVAFTSADMPSAPQQPVAAIPGAPFTPGVPLGTFTFTLQTSATGVPSAGSASLRVHPNPFNPATAVSFELPRPGRAAVTVHDMRGRLVRRLWEGESSGAERVTWNGRDDAGRAVPSAAYVVRVSAEGFSRTVRASLVR